MEENKTNIVIETHSLMSIIFKNKHFSIYQSVENIVGENAKNKHKLLAITSIINNVNELRNLMDSLSRMSYHKGKINNYLDMIEKMFTRGAIDQKIETIIPSALMPEILDNIMSINIALPDNYNFRKISREEQDSLIQEINLVVNKLSGEINKPYFIIDSLECLKFYIYNMRIFGYRDISKELILLNKMTDGDNFKFEPNILNEIKNIISKSSKILILMATIQGASDLLMPDKSNAFLLLRETSKYIEEQKLLTGPEAEDKSNISE